KGERPLAAGLVVHQVDDMNCGAARRKRVIQSVEDGRYQFRLDVLEDAARPYEIEPGIECLAARVVRRDILKAVMGKPFQLAGRKALKARKLARDRAWIPVGRKLFHDLLIARRADDEMERLEASDAVVVGS